MVKKDNEFYLKGGKAIKSLKSLAKELKGMSGDVYDHHVNPVKNDFSNWIKNSLKDENLAGKIDGHISKIELELEVLRHLLLSEVQTKSKQVKKKAKAVSKEVVKKAVQKKKTVSKKAAPKAKKVVSKAKKSLSKKK